MNLYGYEIQRDSDLMHHGIKGQKWGQRRFQNEDGTWTAAGKARYGDDGSAGGNRGSFGGRANSATNTKNTPEAKARSEKLKKAAKIGAAVAGTALVAYGAYKLNKLATESLAAGDRYLAKNKQTMADMALKNYFDQMEIANKVKGPYAITNRTPIETAKKYQKMVETASQAGQRYNTYRKEASAALARADSGKYSVKEKIDELRRMARR